MKISKKNSWKSNLCVKSEFLSNRANKIYIHVYMFYFLAWCALQIYPSIKKTHIGHTYIKPVLRRVNKNRFPNWFNAQKYIARIININDTSQNKYKRFCLVSFMMILTLLKSKRKRNPSVMHLCYYLGFDLAARNWIAYWHMWAKLQAQEAKKKAIWH